MKLRIAGYDLDIEYGDGNCVLFDIKNKNMFSKIVNNIYFYKENSISEILFLDNSELVVPSKRIIFIDSIYSIDINTKAILTKLYAVIKDELQDNVEEFSSLKQGLNMISQSLINSFNSYNLDFDYKVEIEVEDVLKMFGLKVNCSEVSNFEKILTIIELYSELFPDCNLVFINILNYFDTKNIEEVVKYIQYKKLNSLFIESAYEDKLSIYKYILDEEYDLYLDTIQNDR